MTEYVYVVVESGNNSGENFTNLHGAFSTCEQASDHVEQVFQKLEEIYGDLEYHPARRREPAFITDNGDSGCSVTVEVTSLK